MSLCVCLSVDVQNLYYFCHILRFKVLIFNGPVQPIGFYSLFNVFIVHVFCVVLCRLRPHLPGDLMTG